MAESTHSNSTHAGAVVLDPGEPHRVLIIRSKDGKKWVLPKGHIKEDETAADAAVREVREESGVHAGIVKELKTVDLDGAITTFYVMQRTGNSLPMEDRSASWKPYDEALTLLDFCESRDLVWQSRYSLESPRTRDEFLIRDFEQWTTSYWKNEEVGERRVTFLITIGTAALAGIVGLAQIIKNPSSELVRNASIFATLALLAIGSVTLLRMLRRSEAADGYIKALTCIREQFLGPELTEEITAGLPDERIRKSKLWNGGLAVHVAVVNALACAALGAVVIPIVDEWLTVALPPAAFVIALILQLYCIAQRGNSSLNRLP